MRGLIFALLICGAVPALAAEDEPGAIIEIGGAGEWGVRHGDTAYGPSLAAETTPIPDVLELEAGTTEFFPHGATEWDTDFLFKKPFTLTDTLEFMAGAGPEWAHTVTRGASTDFSARKRHWTLCIGPGPSVKWVSMPNRVTAGISAPAMPSR